MVTLDAVPQTDITLNNKPVTGKDIIYQQKEHAPVLQHNSLN
ncbi:hypothetical protein [Pontibacter silvestris]